MILKTIGSRIKKKRKELKLTQQQVASAMKNVSNVAVSQWESDITSPSAKNLFELSIVLKCDIEWLLNGSEQSNIVPAILSRNYKVPIISYVEALSWSDKLDNLVNSEGYEYIMTSSKLSEKSFALKIQGDSMEPEFKDGDIVIIDPTVIPSPGEFVVAQYDNSESTFKKYREIGLDKNSKIQFELISLNSDYNTINNLNQKIKIIGTMVEHRIFRRKR